ncbi:hypothetical protein BDV95DRAFT_90949 [Massariosphaeria phaeospora]|uniref:Uncharacterized protein n=1 Tax=Massariosphaeria phaeospora TaxID=100035 RepID=A0A7C8I749_9PLEO|nr:hypothetical protein BDV95DRAFT_90949 [Massariosphaeria phaeospora]
MSSASFYRRHLLLSINFLPHKLLTPPLYLYHVSYHSLPPNPVNPTQATHPSQPHRSPFHLHMYMQSNAIQQSCQMLQLQLHDSAHNRLHMYVSCRYVHLPASIDRRRSGSDRNSVLRLHAVSWGLFMRWMQCLTRTREAEYRGVDRWRRRRSDVGVICITCNLNLAGSWERDVYWREVSECEDKGDIGGGGGGLRKGKASTCPS